MTSGSEDEISHLWKENAFDVLVVFIYCKFCYFTLLKMSLIQLRISLLFSYFFAFNQTYKKYIYIYIYIYICIYIYIPFQYQAIFQKLKICCWKHFNVLFFSNQWRAIKLINTSSTTQDVGRHQGHMCKDPYISSLN